jgi:hypothetical protein
MRSSIFPASKPADGDRGGVVAGEPVVDLESRAGETTAVHRPDDDLVVERAEQEQVLEDVGGAEDAVDAGTRESEAEPVEQLDPVGHGERVVAYTQRHRAPDGPAAMTMSLPCGPSSDVGRVRNVAASTMASGLATRVPTIP